MIRATTAAAFLAAVLAAGCAGASAAEDDASADGALVGGTVAKPGQFPATVYIDGAERCTAAKVAPKKLLLAAHCVWNTVTFDLRYAPGSMLPIGRDPSKGTHDVQVAAVHVHPQWQKICSEQYCASTEFVLAQDLADVAVIELAQDLADVATAAVDGSPVGVGEFVIVLGFGCTTGIQHPEEGLNGPLKYQETSVVRPLRIVHDGSPLTKADVDRTAGNYFMTGGPGMNRWRPGMCPGDSGGPVYRWRGSSLVVAGVNANYTLLPQETDPKGLTVTNLHARLDGKSRSGVRAFLESVGVPVRETK